MSIVKDVPYVYETEKDLPLRTEIKNRLNPYIKFYVDKLTTKVYPHHLNTMEEGCNLILADLNVRKTLAREHIVNYIIEEYGSEIIG